jgi:hypothetical protein
MMQKPVMRFDKVFLVAFWVFGCFFLWSPWTGTTISACEVGNEMTEYRYGMIGYYSVRFEEYQQVASQFELNGLTATLVATLLVTLFLSPTLALWEAGPIGHSQSRKKKPPGRNLSFRAVWNLTWLWKQLIYCFIAAARISEVDSRMTRGSTISPSWRVALTALPEMKTGFSSEWFDIKSTRPSDS